MCVRVERFLNWVLVPGRRRRLRTTAMILRSLACSTLFLICVGALPACALLPKGSKAQARAAAARASEESHRRPLLVGQVAMVNAEDGFVLVDAATVTTVRAGTIWRTYTGTAVSAELRATEVRRRPWVVADIVSGIPQKNDTVMQPAGALEGTAPRAEAVLPPATEEVPGDEASAKRAPFWKRWFAFRH